MKTYLIIHGHFYQPPRENPYTGILEDQASAKPFDNWNEAIFKTCYEPNAYSRYLDNYGKIKSISNNYSTISANFGPTLLNWIDKEHPEFSKKLIEADKESLCKTGHSNFIAQCYNHVILPLESKEIRRIQIQWALDDYYSRFKHKAEGFWCSECAINKDTIDDLAAAGIKFVILSPWQAVSINNKKLNGKPAPSDKPFIIRGNKSSISAFFYDPDLASGISFGHLLRDADHLFEVLKKTKEEKNNPKLITCATDGEIYGHHEPFGDMALAALIKKVEASDDFEFTNYAAYLEKNPAKDYAELSAGDDGLGSSWSCSHGVGRWYRDCGCHTGGDDLWNQKWRTGMRNAFKNLELRAFSIFTREIHKILGHNTNPVDILLSYSQVLCYGKTIKEFISSFRKEDNSVLSDSEKENLAVLLDAMKNVMFMYTSCGWFFNDISGLEPRQNILYAVYASNALSRFETYSLKNDLLKDLRTTLSNIPSEGNGEDIAKRSQEKIPSFAQAVGFFALNRKMALKSDYDDSFGVYRLISMNNKEMTLLHIRTLEHFRMLYSTQKTKQGTYEISVVNTNTGYKYRFTSNQISHKELRTITKWTDNSIASCISSDKIDSISQSIENYMMVANADKSLIKEGIFHQNIILSLKAIRSQKEIVSDRNWNQYINRIRNLVSFVNLSKKEEDLLLIEEVFNNQLASYSKLFMKNRITDVKARHTIELLALARECGCSPEISELQNAFYPMLTGAKKTSLSSQTMKMLALDLNFAVSN